MNTIIEVPRLSGVNSPVRFLSLLETGLYYDVVIEVTDKVTNQAVKIKAHKCIIAASSHMLENSLRYTANNVLKINEFSSEVVVMLLHYFYTKSINFTSVETCLDVMSAADFFSVPLILPICIKYVQGVLSKRSIDIKLLVKILNKAVMCADLSKLFYIGVAYIEDYPCTILDSHDMKELKLEALLTLIQLLTHLCDEVILFKLFLRWAVYNNKNKSTEDCMLSISYTDYFKFNWIDPDNVKLFFAQNSGIVSKEDEYAILTSYSEINMRPEHFKLRGYPNIIDEYEVTVSQPPLLIIEEFYYSGGPMPTFSIHLVSKDNSYIREFGRNYEEDIKFIVLGKGLDFKGIVERNFGLVCFPFDRLEIMSHKKIKVGVFLNRPGRYRKMVIPKKNNAFNRNGPGIMKLYKLKK